MDFVPLIVGGLMVAMLIDVLRSIKGKDWNGVVTPLFAFVAGVCVAWLLSKSDFASTIKIGDTGLTLHDLNFASIIVFGFAFSSFAAKGVDLISAVAKRPNVKPSLIEGPPPA